MVGGRRNKARRGAFRIRLPVGYVWVDGGIELDPDERVRDTLKLFFSCFARLGSATAVALYFAENSQTFPRRDGWGRLEVAVTWGPLSVSRAVLVLHHPMYAGVYAYDRNNEREEDPEDPCAGGRIWIRDAVPAYITVAEYEQNMARLRDNRTFHRDMMGKGATRDGDNLLQGIAMCGHCGKRVSSIYPRRNARAYCCRDSATGKMCKTFPAQQIDREVASAVLEALRTEELELAVAALEKVNERAADLHQQWRQRIAGARYEAERAARRYHQVEPENRLVARTLEGAWNARLEELQQLEEQYTELQKQPPFHLTTEQRARILDLANDLPQLWSESTTTNRQRKEIVRILIEDVTLRKIEEPRALEVTIRWKSGLTTRHHAERCRLHPCSTNPETVQRIRELAPTHTDQDAAEILNAEGHRTGHGLPFTAPRLQHQRVRLGLLRQPRPRPDGGNPEPPREKRDDT
jgi:hypothetical protein